MPISTPVYCTREEVKTALDVASTARSDTQIDRALEAVRGLIDGNMSRSHGFMPVTGTRKFDWPPLPFSGAFPWRLWLDDNEIISVTSLVSGGSTIPATDYLLEPVNYGPPYSHIDIDLSTSSAFNSGATWQQSTVITGLFGYQDLQVAAGALAADISSTTATTCQVTDSSVVGTGSTLVCGSERVLVTARTNITTSQTQQADLTASSADDGLHVSDGTKYTIGEVLTLDTEKMLVSNIAGNVLTVERAWDGTTLATHTGATVYAPRQLTIVRGILGTTAATHTNGTALTEQLPPPLIRNLSVAEALNMLLQEQAGYSRTVGTGDNERQATVPGLKDLRAQAVTAHARKVRHRTV